MFNGLFDIVFFALVAAFLAFRLYSVLGRRNEEDSATDRFSAYLKNQAKSKMGMGNVISLPGAEQAPALLSSVEEAPAFSAVPSHLLPVVTAIHNADKSFTEQRFLSGARKAFEMILAAFAKGDKDTLKSLASSEVLQDFATEIDSRTQAGEQLDIIIVAILSAEITNATLHKNLASVTVKFTSEQISVVRDNKGEVIAGNPSQIDLIEDSWTFVRNIKASSPNWELARTEE